MSLGYDPQKWTIITMLAILTVTLVGITNLAHAETYGELKERECTPKETEYFSRPNQVQITKNYTGWWIDRYTSDFQCENWKQQVQNYLDKGYTITFEGDMMIVMEAPTTPTTQEDMDKSQDEYKSTDTFLDDEDTGNNSAIEEYVKKYCPEYADPDESQLMVLCDYPEFEESPDIPAPPQD